MCRFPQVINDHKLFIVNYPFLHNFQYYHPHNKNRYFAHFSTYLYSLTCYFNTCLRVDVLFVFITLSIPGLCSRCPKSELTSMKTHECINLRLNA